MRFKFSLLILLCGLLSGGLTGQVIETAPPPPPPPPPSPSLEELGIFKVMQDMPRFPGCEEVKDRQEREECAQQKLLDYVSSNLSYPEIAKVNGLEGMAVIAFIVEKNGELSGIRIVRDPGAGLGEAASKVISQMNTDSIRWIPGSQRGRAVRVSFTLPIRFKLPEEEPKPESPSEEIVFEDMEIEEEELIVDQAPPSPAPKKPIMPDPGPTGEPGQYKAPAPMMSPQPVRETRRVDAPPSPSVREVEIEEEVPPMPEVERVAPPPPPPPPPPSPSNVATDIFKVVEEMPRFHNPDCEAITDRSERKDCAQREMLNTINSNLQYPAIAKENGVEGTCVVTCVVERDGSLADIRLVRDVGAGCGQEAVRLVELMSAPGSWTIGKQRGQPVRVQYNLPVKFKVDQ